MALFQQSDIQGNVENIQGDLSTFRGIIGEPGSGGLFDEQMSIADQQLRLQNLTKQSGARTRRLGDEAAAISRGTDPRFAAFRDAQLAQLQQQRQAQVGGQNEQLARLGLGGSSAAFNQQANLNRQFNLDASSLSGQLGLQQLQRQDAARSQAGGLFGQSAGIFGQAGQLGESAFGIQSGALQNFLAPATLDLGVLAALIPQTGPNAQPSGRSFTPGGGDEEFEA